MSKFVMAFVAVGMFLTAVACSSTPTPTAAGGKCGADTDCESGLKCMEYGVVTAGGCQVNGKQCTKACTTDDDCRSLNDPNDSGTNKKNFKCQAGCTAGSVSCQQ